MKKKPAVLVLGGAGYIGSHTCKALHDEGFLPITYDNLVTGHKKLVKWGPFIKGDILDKNKLIAVIKKYKPVGISHFAAFIASGESVTDPLKYYRNNVIGSISLLEAIKETNLDIKFIFSSSAAVYGMPKKLPISENTPPAPISPYGQSKLIIEEILKDFNAAYGMEYVSLRYFNAVGADPEGNTGCLQRIPTNLFPIIVDAAVKKKKLNIFGTDYPTPDGTAIRDYIHVSDLAAAHVKALKYLLKGKKSIILNLGTGKGYSVKKVVEAFEKVSGIKMAVSLAERRPGDAPTLLASAQLAKKVLGWQPLYKDIKFMLKTSWDWRIKN